MSHVEITLKSGTIIQADVSEWTTRRDAVTNGVAAFNWSTNGPRRLAFLHVEDVAAVVFVDEQERKDH